MKKKEKMMFFPTSNGAVCTRNGYEALSSIDAGGARKLWSARSKNKIIYWHFPFARGLQFFIFGMLMLFHSLLWSERMSEKKKKKDYLVILSILSGIIGIVFAGVVIGYLPGKLGYFIVGPEGNTLLRNFIIAFFRLILLAIILTMLKSFSVVREFFRFNRACDLVSIYGEDCRGKYKSGLCEPLNFLNYLVFVFFLDIFVVTLIGASYNFFLNFLINLAVLLLSIMLCYEILKLIDLSGCSYIKSLCFVTSFFVTMRPSLTHVETVLTAQTEVLFLTSQKDRKIMENDGKKPFSVVYAEVRNKLQSVDESDADWIIATVLNKNRAEVKLVESVTDKEYRDIMRAVARRANGESVDNIFGYTEFYGLRFDVNKKVLTPRMETEILVEQVLKNIKRKDKVLDVGTGSGAIAVTLAKFSDVSISALDISRQALQVAMGNAKKHNVKVEFIESNLFENLKKRRKFDIIVSNPPYIPTKDLAKLDANVRFCDPKLALDGGEDGLNFYREITDGSVKHLKKNGMLFYEVGRGQASAVKKIMKECGFKEIKVVKDYNKIDRVVYGKL